MDNWFHTTCGEKIFYISENYNNDTTVIYLHGLYSDVGGYKACKLHKYCTDNQISLLMFDNFAHGQSSGILSEMTVGKCLSIIEEMISTLSPDQKIIFVGSSMGGALAFLMALRNPQYTKACLGIAPAPDFTQIIWDHLDDSQKQQLKKDGTIALSASESSNTYLMGYQLIEEGNNHLLMNQDHINITCPVRIVHGMRDSVVPYERSLQLIQKLDSDDAYITLIKNGSHRLSKDNEIEIILNQLEELIEILIT